ncbi:MAG: thiamine pyrophosphate-binding protein [Deltaproteobacteria bacterium]|nr:thiamine pyrophosphate-binding protein [Deltaproteobacteria bacterium]
MAETQEKLIVDTLKPRAEMSELEAPPDFIQQFLEEDINVWKTLAEMLKLEGVDTIFGLLAGSTIQAELEMQRVGIKRVHVRHEQTATFAAEGWARLTGRPGVAYTGPATGITNATSGAAQGKAAGSPCIILTFGDFMMDDNRIQGQGLVRAYKAYDGITKYTTRIANPWVTPFEVKRAFRSALSPPMGPVGLEFPGECLLDSYRHGPRMQFLANYHPIAWAGKTVIPYRAADPQMLEKAMEWFFQAERPAIVAGDCIVTDNAIAELQELVALTGIPTHTRRTARGVISEYDPLNCYGRARGRVLRRSDRTLVLGLRIQYLENFGQAPFWSTEGQYIQAQNCPEHTCTGLPTNFELLGDMKTVIRQIIDWCKANGIKKPPERWNDWRAEVAAAKDHYQRLTVERTKFMEGKMPLHPDLAGKLISDFLHEELNDEVYAIADGFTAASYFTDWQKVKFAPSVLDAAETIGFGHSAGHALAFSLLNKNDRPIIAIMGDGAVGAGGMDIETCVRWDVPCVFVHENNHHVATGVQYVFSQQHFSTGVWEKDTSATLPNLRYDQMFKPLGIHTEFVEKDVEMKPALKRAFDFVRDKNKPAFVEVFIDHDVLQEIWGTGLFIMTAGNLPWDEVTPKGKELISAVWERCGPAQQGMADLSWYEGIEQYRAEKAKK